MKHTLLALLLLASTDRAAAALIVQPNIVASTLPASGATDLDNLVNQSGLSATYESRVSDFDDFVSVATHNSNQAGNRFRSTPNQVVTGAIDFALGGTFEVTSFALWGRGDNSTQNIRAFSLLADGDGDFTGADAVDLGTFTLSTNISEAEAVVAARVFDFDAAEAAFVRLTVLSNFGGNATSVGEVAFGVAPAAAVPEPTSAALLGGALSAGAWLGRRRSRKVCILEV